MNKRRLVPVMVAAVVGMMALAGGMALLVFVDAGLSPFDGNDRETRRRNRLNTSDDATRPSSSHARHAADTTRSAADGNDRSGNNTAAAPHTGNASLLPGTNAGAATGAAAGAGRVVIERIPFGAHIRIPGFTAIRADSRRSSGRTGENAAGHTAALGTVDTIPGDTSTEAEADDETATTGSLVGTVTEDGPTGIVPVPHLKLRIEARENHVESIVATTAADGTYHVNGLQPGSVRITIIGTIGDAEADDATTDEIARRYFQSTEHFAVVEIGTETIANIHVRRDHDFVGTVVDSAGTPIHDATVKFYAGAWGHQFGSVVRTVVTDFYGVFVVDELPDARYRVVAEKDGFAPAQRESVRPAVIGPSNPFVIVAQADARVFGRVTDTTTGAGIEGARVVATHHVEGQPRSTNAVLTTADGTYALPVDPRSVNVVTAQRAGFGTESQPGIVPGRIGVDFALSPDSSAVITGVILEPTGHFADHATIAGTPHPLLHGRFWHAVNPGTHTLTILSPSGASAQITAAAPAGLETEVGTISLVAPAPLRVVVMGNGVPVADARVTLPATGETLTAANALVTGLAGYELKTAPADRGFSINVFRSGFPPRNNIAIPADVTQRPDPLVVTLAAGNRAAVVRVTTATGEVVQGATVTRINHSEMAWLTDPDGLAFAVELTGNPESLRITANGFLPITVVAPTALMADEWPVTEATLHPAGSVWGSVTMRGRPLDPLFLPTIICEVPAANFRAETVPVAVSVGGTTVWRYEFPAVPEGDAWVFNDRAFLFPSGPATPVTAGTATAIDVDFPGATVARLRVMWAGPSGPTAFAGASVYLYHRATWIDVAANHTDPMGYVTYPMLPPGGYALSIITNGSSDQRAIPFDVPDQPSFDHVITLQPASRQLHGRVLVQNPAVPYTESAAVSATAAASTTSFTLAIRHHDDTTETLVAVTGGPFADAAHIATALAQTPTFSALGLTATTVGATLVVGTANATVRPFFAVSPHDALARAIFGAAPFLSSHRAQNTRVAMENLDAQAEELLAGYMSVDAQGYFAFQDCVAGRYRPRVVPHYTGAPYAHAFGREVDTTPHQAAPAFVTIWTTGAGSYVDLTGAVQFAGPGILRTQHYVKLYVEAVDDISPTTGLPRRSGHYSGNITGTWSVPRVPRGQRYRVYIHAKGMTVQTVEIDVPAQGHPIVSGAPVTLKWYGGQ